MESTLLYRVQVARNTRCAYRLDIRSNEFTISTDLQLRLHKSRRRNIYKVPVANRNSNETRSNLADIHATNGAVRQLAAHQSAAHELESENQISSTVEITPFGALQPLIDAVDIEEIWINSPQRIYIARGGKSELTNIVLTTSELQSIMDRVLMWCGKRIDLSHPFVDARLPDGSRLHIAIPEITAEHWAVNIRKHLMRGKSLQNLVEFDVMSGEISEYLVEAVHSQKNILVSGSTQAGKTTLLNALVSSVPIGERVITIEEVFELKPKIPDCVAMQTRSANLDGVGEISIRRLIKEALRMRPSRLVIGEIRDAESLDLLIALNSGIPGMATIHANSAQEAIRKLQTLPLLAGENITQDFLTPTVFNAIDLVVHVALDREGKRRIQQVARVNNRSENFHIEIDNEFFWDGERYLRGLHL